MEETKQKVDLNTKLRLQILRVIKTKTGNNKLARRHTKYDKGLKHTYQHS